MKPIKDEKEQRMNYPSAWLFHQVRHTLPSQKPNLIPALIAAASAMQAAKHPDTYPTYPAQKVVARKACQILPIPKLLSQIVQPLLHRKTIVALICLDKPC